MVVGCCWESWEMERALHALTQAMVDSFFGDGSGFFLFGFCIFFLFTVYHCNELILYGLLNGF
jgi:hypothetical protein